MLDGLGFKGIWERETPADVVKRWDTLTDRVLRAFPHSRLIAQHMTALYGDGFPKRLRWECRIISDTLIMTCETRGSPGPALAFALPAVLGALYEASIRDCGWLFRGAVSAGIYYEGRRALIGPAIDEAASWYQATNWAGVMLTQSAEKALMCFQRDWDTLAGRGWVRTEIPLKNGHDLSGFALAWPARVSTQSAQVSQSFGSGNISREVTEKRRNTMRFFDEVARQLLRPRRRRSHRP